MTALRHAGSHLHGRHDNVGLEADGSVGMTTEPPARTCEKRSHNASATR